MPGLSTVANAISWLYRVVGVELETEHLYLKPLSEEDFDELVVLRSDPDVMRFVGEVQDKERICRFITMALAYQEKHGIGFCSVFQKSDGIFVGQAGLFHVGYSDRQSEIELGYRFHKKYWGKGYATESAKALILWARSHLEVDEVIAFTMPENGASRRVLVKVGFDDLGQVDTYYGHVNKFRCLLRSR